MRHSKFYTLLSTCTPGEVSGYHKFLRHTHPNRKDVLQLMVYVRKVQGLPDAESRLDLDCYQEIHKKESGYNRKALLNTLFDLHQLLKHYLLAERVKTDVPESRTLWLSILRERGLEDAFSRQALKYIGDYETAPKASLTDYLNLLVVQHQYYYHFTNDSELDGFKQIKKSAAALEMYSQAVKYRMLCEVIHLGEFLPSAAAIDDFIRELKLQPMAITRAHPLLLLYQELSILLKANDYAQFDRLTALIEKHAALISTKELEELLLFMNNLLSVLNRAGQSLDNMERAHRLNKIALKHKTYQLKGEMRIAHFLNIVTIACKVKDPAWALHFASGAQDLLPEAQRNDAVQLSQAIIHFEKKHYKGALKLLTTIRSRDIYIQYRAKMLLLICHFELKTPDVDLPDYCINTGLYIKRNLKPLQDAVTSSGLNFIRIVKMLLRGNATKQKILDEIHSAQQLVFREWLLEKAALYKKI